MLLDVAGNMPPCVPRNMPPCVHGWRGGESLESSRTVYRPILVLEAVHELGYTFIYWCHPLLHPPHLM